MVHDSTSFIKFSFFDALFEIWDENFGKWILVGKYFPAPDFEHSRKDNPSNFISLDTALVC